MEVSYRREGEKKIFLGSSKVDGISFPIATSVKALTRHRLIASPTGTGKSVMLELVTGALPDLGTPVLLMDIKGDLSGIAEPLDVTDAIKAFVKEPICTVTRLFKIK